MSDVKLGLRQLAQQAPTDPGVYQMLDKSGAIIYVGKAKNLRKRVSSYFNKSEHERPLTQLLVRNIVDIQYIVTGNESEALLLENTLIKKVQPRYNVRLRDDKDYVCLRLSIQHPFPRLTIVRRPKTDGAKYYGPFVASWQIRKLSRYLLKIFPLRSCSDRVIKQRHRPCILYDIKLCTAPCVDKISTTAYAELVMQLQLFLQGKNHDLKKQLKQQMQQAAAKMEYDLAAQLRDRLQEIEASQAKQHVIFHDQRDVDVIGSYRDHATMAVVILTLRQGKVIGKREILCEQMDDEHAAETVESILTAHYLNELLFIPPQILLDQPLPNQSALQINLSLRVEHKVELLKPQRGAKLTLVQMAQKNARLYLEQQAQKTASREQLLQQLQQALSLPHYPQRIETYDISNLQGTHAVASQVVFVDGEPDKRSYRKYKIKRVQGANDVAMLQEVVRRRLAKPTNLPQLMLIDGGKGQLNAVAQVVKAMQVELPELTSLALASIAKVPIHAMQKQITTDRIFVPGRKNHLALKAESPVLKLLQRCRDEAHRFALAFHHQQKHQDTLKSALVEIPGLGRKTVMRLLKHFGSLQRVQQASEAELSDLKFLNQKMRQSLKNYFATALDS